MGDPTRLLARASDADELERALLETLHVPEPAQAAQAEMWRGIATQLVAASLVGAAPLAASSALAATSAATSSAAPVGATAKLASTLAALTSKALLTKVALVAVAVGSVSVGGVVAWQQHLDVAPRAKSVPAASAPARAAGVDARALPAELPSAGESAAASTGEAPAPAAGDCTGAACAPLPASVAEPARRARRDLLLAESKLLSSARAALLAGDLRAAQSSLSRLASKYPRGVLLQEREVLTIDVLTARGQLQAARRNARAFVAAHPESPHAVTLRRFLEAP